MIARLPSRTGAAAALVCSLISIIARPRVGSAHLRGREDPPNFAGRNVTSGASDAVSSEGASPGGEEEAAAHTPSDHRSLGGKRGGTTIRIEIGGGHSLLPHEGEMRKGGIPPTEGGADPLHYGEQNALSPRIIGGERAKRGDFPYFAAGYRTSIRYGGSPKWSGCGGCLVASDVVLTAAHCVEDDMYTYSFVIGAYCDKDDTDYNCRVDSEYIRGESVYTHPLYHKTYSGDNWIPHHDFALVKLEKKSSIEVPQMDDGRWSPSFSPGRELTVIGFGKTSFSSGYFPYYLQQVTVTYIDNVECSDDFKTYGGVTSAMMCAKDEGKDACTGDSGGPVFIRLDDDSYGLVGVTSWGKGCASTFPGVSARISHAWGWIRGTVCHASSYPPFECPVEGGASKRACTDVPDREFTLRNRRSRVTKTCGWLARLSESRRVSICSRLRMAKRKCRDTCAGLCDEFELRS